MTNTQNSTFNDKYCFYQYICLYQFVFVCIFHAATLVWGQVRPRMQVFIDFILYCHCHWTAQLINPVSWNKYGGGNYWQESSIMRKRRWREATERWSNVGSDWLERLWERDANKEGEWAWWEERGEKTEISWQPGQILLVLMRMLIFLPLIIPLIPLFPLSSLPFLCLSEGDVFISRCVQLQCRCDSLSRARLVCVCYECVSYPAYIRQDCVPKRTIASFEGRFCVFVCMCVCMCVAHQLESLLELSKNIFASSQHPPHTLSGTSAHTRIWMKHECTEMWQIALH